LIKRFKLAAGFGVLAVSAAGILALATPAHAAADTCKNATTVTVKDRHDSGTKGDWAKVTYTRTVKVCEQAGTGEVSDYKATVTDDGSFVALANAKSPQSGSALPDGVKGSFGGGFTATFKAAAGFATFKPDAYGKTVTGDEPKTSTWVKGLFGADFTGSSIDDNWKWTYTTCGSAKDGEEWVNATDAVGGNEGDITGKACPTKSPTARPTAYRPTVAPPATTDPGAAGGLPVTGTSLPLYVGGGVALLLVGAGAVWLTRRRVRIEA
jgi:hypothetical protein